MSDVYDGPADLLSHFAVPCPAPHTATTADRR